MTKKDLRTIGSDLIHMAIEFGASSAGIANIKDLKGAPSFVMMPERPHIDRVGAIPYETGLPEGVVAWEEGMKSVLVITYAHSEKEKHLDWWIDEKNPLGNKKLMDINQKVYDYINSTYTNVLAKPLNYYVEKGGVWLKDSAVIAGLGVIGKNNLLVTPQYGPRVRLRAMFLNIDIPSTGPLNWDPCENCAMPCRTSCPQNVFSEKIYSEKDYSNILENNLPGRDGTYNLKVCDIQMQRDEEADNSSKLDIEGYGRAESIIDYCRNCELNCLVGRGF